MAKKAAKKSAAPRIKKATVSPGGPAVTGGPVPDAAPVNLPPEPKKVETEAERITAELNKLYIRRDELLARQAELVEQARTGEIGAP